MLLCEYVYVRIKYSLFSSHPQALYKYIYIYKFFLPTFPVGGNRKTRRKPTTFGNRVDELFPRAINTGLEPMTSVVGGHRLDD